MRRISAFDGIPDAENLSRFRGWNRSVHRKTVVMIKSIPVGPRRKGSFPSGHEELLKARHRLNPALGISRGDHAALARVVASEGDVADPERFEFLRSAEKTVFPERLHHVEFKIRPESPTRSFECQTRKPTSDLLQAPFTDNRWTGR